MEKDTKLFNKYLNVEIVLLEWRVAHITSPFKKGNKKDCSNYRGLNVTATIGRQ